MKTTTTTAIFAAITTCATTLILASAMNLASTAQADAAPLKTQTVTVRAARMSDAEKKSYDLEMQQSAVSQVIVVRAKRLTAEEKAADVAAETVAKSSAKHASK